MKSFKALSKKFNPAPLKKEIARVLGFKPRGLKIELVENKQSRFGMDVEITSKNLVEHAGFMARALRSIQLQTFGFGIDVPTDRMWIQVHLRYIEVDGGGNGTNLMNAWWDFKEDTWEFSVNADRKITMRERDIKRLKEYLRGQDKTDPINKDWVEELACSKLELKELKAMVV